MASNKNVGVRGKVIHSQAREIVANVLAFMRKEAEEGVQIPLSNYKERVLAATKIGEGTYRKIQMEAREISVGKKKQFSSPSKNRNRPSPKSDLTEGELQCIRSIILHYYCVSKKNYPTLKEIYNRILESGVDFKGGLSTLSKVIKNLGFRWCKTVDNRKVLLETNDICLKRTVRVGRR